MTFTRTSCFKVLIALFVGLQVFFSTAFASQPIKVASYNLGWWLSQDEFKDYVSGCFNETPEKLIKLGADIRGLPYCNVYAGQDAKSLILAPTLQYWLAKKRALKLTVERTDADIMAFIEVSGKLAVEQMLGDTLKNEYWMCESAINQKLGDTREQQRLVIIARKSVFLNPEVQTSGCFTEEGIRVSDSNGNYTRPALVSNLTTTLGKPLTIIALHLKSRCVSPAGDENYSWSGDFLNSESPHCVTLRKQVAPLEEIVNKYTVGDKNVIMLGDFNRKIHLEIPLKKPDGYIEYKAGYARLDEADKPKSTAGIPLITDKVRLLWPEIISFVATKVDGKWDELSNPILTVLKRDIKNTDCKGFDGLDHITISNSLSKVNPYAKVREIAQDSFSNFSIPASDHCPIATNLIIP